MEDFDSRIDDIMGSSIEAAEVLNDLDRALEELKEYEMYLPLQTIQSMADRWGVSRQTVNNWASRHDDFPKEVEGWIEKTARTPKVYARSDVERYEKLRRLGK